MLKPYVSAAVCVLNVSIKPLHDAAIVTRVWGDGPPACVNLCVLADGQAPMNKTSVYLFADRAAADKYLATMPGHSPVVAFWPDALALPVHTPASPVPV